MNTAATLGYIWEENKSAQNTLEATTVLKKLKTRQRQSSLEIFVGVLDVLKHLQMQSILHCGVKLLTISNEYERKKAKYLNNTVLSP